MPTRRIRERRSPWFRSLADSVGGVGMAVLGGFLFVGLGPVGCREPASPRASNLVPDEREPPSEKNSVPGAVLPSLLAALDQTQERQTQRWLWVEKVRAGRIGAWATGHFDAPHNKLIVETKDVDAFAIDTERVPIDWTRLTIIRIDGRNSELRRRAFSVYHFSRDAHGQWNVQDRRPSP